MDQVLLMMSHAHFTHKAEARIPKERDLDRFRLFLLLASLIGLSLLSPWFSSEEYDMRLDPSEIINFLRVKLCVFIVR
jgi:hypothetical protein